MAADAKFMEAWLTLVAEATRGATGAQEAFRAFSKTPFTPADLSRWMTAFMPGMAFPTTPRQPEMFEQWLEEWCSMMGVVPRSRYLDLLENYDALRRRLEKAQETIRKLRATLDGKGQQEQEAEKVLELWNTMLEESLKMQVDWTRGWIAAGEKKEKPVGRAGEGNDDKLS
jgi:hypothetical protein